MPKFDVLGMTLDVSTLQQGTVTLANKVGRTERNFAATEGGSGGQSMYLLGIAFRSSWDS